LDCAHCEAYVIWTTFRKLTVFLSSRAAVLLSPFCENQ
jgi:hypothetical protein